MTPSDRGDAAAERGGVQTLREALLALSPEERVSLVAETLEHGHEHVLAVATDHETGVWLAADILEAVDAVRVADTLPADAIEAAIALQELLHGGHVGLPETSVIDLRPGAAEPDREQSPGAASTRGRALTGSVRLGTRLHRNALKGSGADVDAVLVDIGNEQPVSAPTPAGPRSKHAAIPLDTPELVAYRDQILDRLQARKQILRQRRGQDRSA